MTATVERGLFPRSFRLLHEIRPEWRIAVLIRPEDGAFQHAALAENIDRRTTRIYELPANRSLDEMPEDIFVFINRPVETLNHRFFEELAAQAMRTDCGLVTGISLDRTGRVLHEPFAGIHFSQHELLRDILVVRLVDAISGDFFALKRAQIVSLGGRGSRPPRQCVRTREQLSCAGDPIRGCDLRRGKGLGVGAEFRAGEATA